MKLFDRIKTRRDAKQKSAAQLTLSQFLEALGISDELSGPPLSEATYFACMKVLSESIGKLPFRVLQQTREGGVVVLPQHKFWHAIYTAPNRYMTATVFWTYMEFCRNHYGNAYAYIDYRNRDKPQLWPLDPSTVTVYYDDARKLADQPDVYYRYSGPQGFEVYSSEEILHFKSHLTKDGLVGISVREQLADTIQGQIKAQKLVNKLYDNGMTAKAVLQYTGSLEDEKVTELIARINEYTNNSSTGKVVPIPIGFTLTPLNLKLADSQFFEIKQLTALQIAAAFGVKPSQIGDYSKSSYASSEAQQLSFLVDTLLYIVKGYGEELTTKLLSVEEEQAGMRIKAQTSVLLRADQQTQIDTFSKAVNNFILTPNEAREELDRPHVPGGDKLLGNGASIPIDAVGDQYKSN